MGFYVACCGLVGCCGWFAVCCVSPTIYKRLENEEVVSLVANIRVCVSIYLYYRAK